MQQNLPCLIRSALLGLGMLAISPANADVIDVSVSGSVSGSGTMSVECAPVGGNCMPATGGLTPHETVMYNFSASTSDSASATAPDGLVVSTIDAYANQGVTATADSILLSVSAGFSAEGIALYVGETDTDDVLASFDLTQASVVTFSAGGSGGEVVDELLDSQGNVIANIGSTLAMLVDLEPGMYALEVNANGGTSEAIPGGQLDVTDFQFALGASFVPVPEPRSAVFAALLPALLAICIASRRRTA